MASCTKDGRQEWTLLAKVLPLVGHNQGLVAKMKIGLSYSRCVRDIVDGIVDIDDVLVVITRTDFDPHNDEQWRSIWEGYHDRYGLSNPEWANYPPEDEDRFRSISIELWETGKMHQPRKFGAHPSRRPEIWLETVLPNSELENNPAAKMAWDKFQTIAGLSNVELDDKYR